MTESEQIKAIAEIDGFLEIGEKPYGKDETRWFGRHMNASWPGEWWDLPPYLTSRDAIVPVIEKQTWTTRIFVLEHLLNRNCSREIISEEVVKVMLKTPAEICEAVLHATGKWKD